MELINYTLLTIVTYIGIFCGVVLSFISPEELKPGRRYFLIMQKILLFLMSISLFYHITFINIILSLTIVLFAIIQKNSFIAYLLFAIIIFINVQNIALVTIISVLIFLYGLPTGSLLSNTKKKTESLLMCLRFGYYPLLAVLLAIVIRIVSPSISSYL